MEKINEYIYEKVIERKEDLDNIIKEENYLKRIHCNGCTNQCKLSNPQCGRGMVLQKRFKTISKTKKMKVT